MSEYSVVLFQSTAHAIRAEKILKQAEFRIKMIPTPRQLSSNCGMALRFERAEEDQLIAALNDSKVPVSSVHAI
jgi:hypothetical protein